MKAYQLETFEYDTYSYSGISLHESYVHLTEEGAKAHAKALGLAVVEYCQDPEKHAVIQEITLLD